MEAVTCPACKGQFSNIEKHLNHLPLCYVEKCVELNITPVCTSACCKVAKTYDASMIKNLSPDNLAVHAKFLYYGAAQAGDIPTIEWIKSKGFPFNNNLCVEAAKNGHLKVLEWLAAQNAEFKKDMQNRSPFAMTICEAAAQGGHLDIIQWILGDSSGTFERFSLRSLCAAAARGGHLNVLQWLHKQHNAPVNESVCESAAEGNHLEVFKWAKEQGCTWKIDSTTATAEDFSIPKWALEQHLPWRADAGSYAAKNGRYQWLKWALESGYKFDTRIWTAIAEEGSVDMLAYFLNANYPAEFDPVEMAEIAARRGHLDILKWGQTQGWKFNDRTWRAALEGGSLDVLKWLKENDYPWWITNNEFALVADSGNVDTLKWLAEIQPPKSWTRIEAAAVNGKSIDVMKWVIANSTSTVEQILSHGNSTSLSGGCGAWLKQYAQ